MPVHLRDVIAFLDGTLEVERFTDYAPNGLQVEGAPEVDTVVCGVSANAALLERAVQLGADLVVVHHGLLWGAGAARITGLLARRLAALLRHDMSLAAYHLPLDRHARLGNNVGLADALGLTLPSREWFGLVKGVPLGLAGAWSAPVTRPEAVARVEAGLRAGRPLPFQFLHGPEVIRKVGLCTGAGSDLLEDAARAGCDLFVTGELAERAVEVARELQLNLVAAGHHATEVFGAQRVADELRMRFPALAVHFVDVPGPV
jgi:dinuclear metal center YbgI/SA1388 family protein